MNPGYVIFRLGQQTFALSLEQVREIVRLAGLERLPGTRPPVAGVIVHRGEPLPVVDIRATDQGDSTESAACADAVGDVLVMDVAGDRIGVAVDAVVAVVSAADLPDSSEPPSGALPSYVFGVRRGAAGPVLLVDMERLLEHCAEDWTGWLSDPNRDGFARSYT